MKAAASIETAGRGPETTGSTPAANPTAAEECRRAISLEIESGAMELPVLPEVAGEVLTLTRDPNADLADFSELVHRDPAIASHVLRIANSAASGSANTIVSLQQAIARLGMQLLSEIALTISLQGNSMQAPGFEAMIRPIWTHAFATAVYGREIARLKRSNVEGQFLCGLLHSVGKPAVLQAVRRWQLSRKKTLSQEDLVSVVDEFYSVVGASICEKWKLPRQVQTACSFHRDYARAPAFRQEVLITFLAAGLAHGLTGPDTGPDAGLPDGEAFGELNLYPDEVESLIAKRESIRAAVAAMKL